MAEELRETAFEPLRPESDEMKLLAVFATHRVQAIVVGGYAVRFHGHFRTVADLDLVVDRSAENLARLRTALSALNVAEASRVADAFAESPRQKWRWRDGKLDHFVDLLASAEPFAYAELAQDAVRAEHYLVPVRVMSRPMLIKAKRAALADAHRAARWTQDREDLEALSRGGGAA